MMLMPNLSFVVIAPFHNGAQMEYKFSSINSGPKTLLFTLTNISLYRTYERLKRDIWVMRIIHRIHPCIHHYTVRFACMVTLTLFAPKRWTFVPGDPEMKQICVEHPDRFMFCDLENNTVCAYQKHPHC